MSTSNKQAPLLDPENHRDITSGRHSIRTEFGMTNCHTRGYPSQGGIILGTFTGVELDWLGLSRLQRSYRSSDVREEDEFCYQMLRLGAQWWKSSAYYEERSRQASGGYPWSECFPPELHVGYPSSGGVWVLKVSNGEFGPDDFARVVMASAMDERSDVLRVWGATFYPTVEDCPDIPTSLEDGIAIGRRYEQRMEDMDK